jgi:ketosteroid isomerase-like protein
MEKKAGSGGFVTKKWMEEYFESFNKFGVAKTFPVYFAEDAVFKTAWEKESHGRENIIKFMREIVHHGDKIKETLMPFNIVIDGDNVAVELLTEMVALEDVPNYHVGSFKKGEKINWRLSAFYKIRDGKIAQVQVYVVLEEWLRKWIR